MTLLHGVRVLELSVAWAGPLAGRVLGDLGAEVIKVEHPTSRGVSVEASDDERGQAEIRSWTWGTMPGPVHRAGFFADGDPGDEPWNRQGFFNKINRNKRSLALDMKTGGGREVFERLVERSDVVLANFSPRALRSLNVDHASLSAINPRIITLALSGYGADGPYADRLSYGPMVEGDSGLMAITGYLGDEPRRMGNAFPDAVGGMHAALAVLVALAERDRTGVGQYVDVSQLESYASVAGEAFLVASLTGETPARRGNRSLRHAPQGVYPCRGPDSWIAITIEDDSEWRALVAQVGDPQLEDDCFETVVGRRRCHDQIDAVLADWTRTRDKMELMHQLQASGVRAFASYTNRDLLEDAHLRERDLIVDFEHPVVGRRSHVGFPLHFSTEHDLPTRAAPTLGEANEYVVRTLLGMTPAEFRELLNEGALADRPPA